MSIKQILLIPHLKVHNANALSSPFTIGFPAMTAFLGCVHALQRKLNKQGIDVSFEAVGVVSHEANLQSYKGDNDFVHSIIGTGNPLEPKSDKDKPDGNAVRSSFIEEARIHLDVSLIVEFSGISSDQRDELVEATDHLLQANMKLAGGDIQSLGPLQLHLIDRNDDESLSRFQRQLMPGYVLIERRELMQKAMEEGQDAIDAMLDYLAIHHHCEIVGNADNSLDTGNSTNVENISWTSARKLVNEKSAGWIVPIATGFHGISELGKAKNQRDEDTPHRFAESVITLGEFKMPHRIKNVEHMLWRYNYADDQGLYLCHQSATQLTHANDFEQESSDEEFPTK
jgi:CRISPR-associated protein Csy2